MSDIQARHQFRQDYKALGTLMYEMAIDGRRFDQADFDTLQPMLNDLCDQADALPEFARAIAGTEGIGMLRWYVGQWPKRETDKDETPEQQELAVSYAKLAIRIMESLKLGVGWDAKNLIGIDPSFDAYLVKRIVQRELGLFSYDLEARDRYEDDYDTEAQSKGRVLADVVSSLADAGRLGLLNDLVQGFNELAAVDPESIPAHTRAQLFMGCFYKQREQVGSALKATLGALLPKTEELDISNLIRYDADNFYSVMINAAASGMREEVEPLIQIGLSNNYCTTSFKQLLTGIEAHTNIDVAEVMVSLSHKVAANDTERDSIRDILVSYYFVSDTPVVPDQIEFEVNDLYLFERMIRNQYSAYYDAETQSPNMKNVKALMCEYLGQHAGQLKAMAAIPEIAHIVKTLPYWHDHNFAVDLGI